MEFEGKEWNDVTWEKRVKLINRQEKCARCGRIYLMKNNFGKWYCFQHVADILSDGSWPCCKQYGINAKGCVACDHTDIPDYRWFKEKRAIMPAAAAISFRPKNEAVVESHLEGAIWIISISRYDEQNANEIEIQ